MSRCREFAARCLAVVGAALTLTACGDGARDGGGSLPAQAPVRHLLAEPERVDLVEGFGSFQRPELWVDPEARAADRDALLVLAPRDGLLRWRVDTAGATRFRAGVLRLPFGPVADSAACSVELRLLDAAGAVLTQVQADVPPAAEAPDARVDNWHEAPHSVDVDAFVDAPVAAIELSFRSTDPPATALLGLLDPRVSVDPERVSLATRPIAWPEHSRRLMSRLDMGAQELQPFDDWRCVDPADVQRRTLGGLPHEGTLVTEPVREEGAFEGRKPRHALAFLDGAVARWRERDVGGLRLRGAVALDTRMPAGAAGEFVLRVGGEVRARVPVASPHWTPVDVDLGVPRDARDEVELELALEFTALPDADALVSYVDLTLGTTEQRAHRARRLRAGFAEARLESPWGEQAREPASAERPSVLLIHCETLRADVLGGDGVPAELTPNLARAAGAGVRYTRAVAPSPWTLPSSATLFTGLSPSSHGVVNHDRAVLPDAAVTLAERLRAAGWVTGGMVTNTLLNGHAGWARGFVDWLELPYAHMRQLGALARDWVAAQGDARWFLFLHPFDPHGPNNAPAEFRDRFVEPELRELDFRAVSDVVVRRMEDRLPLDPASPELRFLRQRYHGDVAFLDRELDRLLDALDEQGVLDTTALVFTADHGEEFGEHGLWGHGSNLMGPSTRVPLLIVPPGALAGWARGEERANGQVVDAPVSTDGLHATLLGLLGVAPPELELRPALGEQRGRQPASWLETDKAPALDVRVFVEPAREDGAPRATAALPGDPLRRPLRGVRSAEHLLVRHLPLPDEVDPATGAPRAAWEEFWELGDGAGAPARALPLEGADYARLSQYLGAQLQRVERSRLRAPAAGGGLEQLANLSALGYLHDVDAAPPVDTPPPPVDTKPTDAPMPDDPSDG